MTHLLKINKNLLSCGLKSVTGVFALEIAETAESIYGIEGDKLLNLAGLNRQDLETENSQIPSFHVFAMVLNIIRLTQDEAVGLHLGKLLTLKAFHMLGYVLMNCRNLGEMLQRTLRYERLVMESSLTTFEKNNDKGILKWEFDYSDSEARYFRELVITGWLAISRSMVCDPSSIQLEAVHFPHAAPSCGNSEYERIYECPVHFNADFCGVVFNLATLDIPYVSQDPILSGLMQQYADIMLGELNENVSFLSTARSTIYQLMPSGDLSFERFAEEMRLSHKILYKRFKKAGMTYSELVDDVRRILAMIYLENLDINLLDVALLVGFTDQSSFSRAFKRWYDEPPGDYRKKAVKSGGLYTKKMDTLLHTNYLPSHVKNKQKRFSSSKKPV